MAERNHFKVSLKPGSRLLAGLSATALLLLWWQLLSDISFRHEDTGPRTLRTSDGTLVTLQNIKVRDVDLGPKVESLRLSIEAAQLVYHRCSQPTISTLESCFDKLFDDRYYSSRTILPIAEALSLAQGQAKEVTYTISTNNRSGQLEGAQKGKFYCLNPVLSSAEQSMWSVITETDEKPDPKGDLLAEAKDRICREQARF